MRPRPQTVSSPQSCNRLPDDIPTLSLFCGAGGDYEGAKQVDGIRGVGAANHDALAIATHQLNHDNVTHFEVDITQFNPQAYPDCVLLLASPECRAHSYAPGLRQQVDSESLEDDDTANRELSREQSRMTMFEVVRVLHAKQPLYAIVENVPEVVAWQRFPQWDAAVKAEGYQLQYVNLNAQFVASKGSPTPQSRDRLFLVCTKDGYSLPDMTFSPPAVCPECGPVNALQVFKRPETVAGRYNRQYVYVCPECWYQNRYVQSRQAAIKSAQVEPHSTPAETIIDWSLPCPTIGSRPKLLRPATLQRVGLGLLKYGVVPAIVETCHTQASKGHVRSSQMTLPTQTGRQSLALAQPFISELRHNNQGRSLAQPLSTVCTSGAHHALVEPPPGFLVDYYGTDAKPNRLHDLRQPLPTQASVVGHALTLCKTVKWSATELQAAVLACGFRMLVPHEIIEAMGFYRYRGRGQYRLLGNQRQQTKLAGLAVVPEVMKCLVERVQQALNQTS